MRLLKPRAPIPPKAVGMGNANKKSSYPNTTVAAKLKTPKGSRVTIARIARPKLGIAKRAK